MARQFLKADKLVEILNGQLVRYDTCIECRFKSIVPLEEADQFGLCLYRLQGFDQSGELGFTRALVPRQSQLQRLSRCHHSDSRPLSTDHRLSADRSECHPRCQGKVQCLVSFKNVIDRWRSLFEITLIRKSW